MKKILRCGLFTLIASNFMSVDASDFNRLGASNSSSSSSQSTAVSPEVVEILQNIDSIASDWSICLHTRFGVADFSWRREELSNFFHKVQTFKEKQVQQLITGLEQASERDSLYYEGMLGGVEFVKPFDNPTLSKLRRMDIKALVRVINAIRLLPRVNDAYVTLYNKASFENDTLDEEALTVFLDFVRIMHNDQDVTTWDAFDRALAFVFPEVRGNAQKKFPAYNLLKAMVEASYAQQKEFIIWGSCDGDVRISVIGGNDQNSALFKPCKICFFEPGLHAKADVVSDLEAQLLTRILLNAGAVSEMVIDSITQDFYFPSPKENHFDSIELKNATISSSIIELLSKCKSVEKMKIGRIYGNVDGLIGVLEKGNIKGINCEINKENPELLQWIRVNKPELLQGTVLNLTGVEDDKLFDTLSEEIAISDLPGIKEKHKGCVISSAELDKVHDIDEFGSLLSKYAIEEYVYFLRKGERSDSLIALIPHISITLNKMTFQLPFNQREAGVKIALKHILDYCHNMREITSFGSHLKMCSLIDPYREILHPFINSASKDDDSFVRGELNKLRYAGWAGMNWNVLTEEKEGWYRVTEGDPLNNYIALLKGIISNNREFREGCATIIKVLSALKIDGISLRPLNDKLAERCATLADVELPKLMRTIELIRKNCYVQLLRQERIIEARTELFERYKWFENEQNTFYAIIAQIKDVIAKMIAASPDEEVRAKLKSINVDEIFAPIMAKYRDCSTRFQEVYSAVGRMNSEIS